MSISFITSPSRFINRLLSVGANQIDSPTQRQIKRLFVGFLWGIMFFDCFSLTLSVLFGYLPTITVPVAITIFILIVVLTSLHLRPALFSACVHVICAYFVLVLLGLSLINGGANTSIGSVIIIPTSLIPILALTILGSRAGKFWLGAFFIAIITLAMLPNWVQTGYIVAASNFNLSNSNSAFWGFWVGNELVLFLIVTYFIRQRDEFQRKSDDLLRNILPDAIAERLKDNSTFIAEHFDQVSVLFADVVAFTPMSAQMSPNELVSLLNDVFSEFDRLVEQHGVEKIKTIGDCYMAAAGVPHPRDDHAQALTKLALEMQALVASRNFQGHTLRFRIGLNSGSLTAGVIGRRKFIYDLWGDTVNIASRMESHGAGGCIQITEATYKFIKDDFVCETQGTIHVKGKGEMQVWHVLDQKV